MGSLQKPSLIALFLKEWDETISAKTIQSDEIQGIRIISIHKSKGLEFPHVIIPFCDWEQQGNILWVSSSSSSTSSSSSSSSEYSPSSQIFSLPLIPVDYSSKQLLGTIYEPAYHHEHLQNTVDNLNLLYVAFTRASRTLTVLGKRNALASSRSSLIEQVLPQLQEALPNSTLSGLSAESDPILFLSLIHI